MGLFQVIASLNGGSVSGGGGGSYFTPLVAGTVVDDGFYNAFGFTDQLSDGTIIDIFKKSADHASKGPMTIAKSINGGASWTYSQLTIGATPIECAALSFCVLGDGRLLVGYQDDELYTSLKFAYSDDNGVTWTGSASVLTNGTGLSFSPVKMRVLPSGKILCGYYTGYGALEDAEIGFVQSTNDGVSWSFGPSIFVNAGGVFGQEKGYEFAFEIVDNTGVDATCKLIALVRNAENDAYMHYYSSDGGTTWATDTTSVDNPGAYSRHYMLVFGGFSKQSPVDMFLHNGYVYVVNGYRDSTSGYTLDYTRCTAAEAFVNIHHDWEVKTTLLTTAINSVHFGYPVCFEDYQGKLWCLPSCYKRPHGNHHHSSWRQCSD